MFSCAGLCIKKKNPVFTQQHSSVWYLVEVHSLSPQLVQPLKQSLLACYVLPKVLFSQCF